MDRSHRGWGVCVCVQCTWTITLVCFFFSYCPLFIFILLSSAYLQNYASYGYEILWVDRSYQVGVQCTWTVTLGCLIFELLPFVYFHTWILSGAHLQNCTNYGYEILWVDRSHQGGVQCTWTVTLACLSFKWLPFLAHLVRYCDRAVSGVRRPSCVVRRQLFTLCTL